MADEFHENSRVAAYTALTFEQIAALDSREAVQLELTRAEDACLSIETQLEFFPASDDSKQIRGRRVTALVYWRIARKNLTRRLSEVKRLAEPVK